MGELHLVHGADEALVSQAVAELARRLVGDADRALMVADLTLDGEEVTAGRVVSEAQTPPFLTDKRVVVVREVQGLDGDQVAVLAAYLAEPLATTDLVLAHAGKPAKKLVDAVTAGGGHVTAVDVGASRRDRTSYVEEQVAASGIRLTAAAQLEIVDQLGEDLNRLAGVLDTLAAAFGPATRLDIEDVSPYLGDGGGIPPWELTDAIDRGEREASLEALARMVRGGGRHPLQVMAILHAHYGRLLRLDGSGATDEASAGAVIGAKGFAARKTLERARAMGPEAVHDAIQLLAQADLDLRGRRELPDDAVLEVLVARLCRLSRTRQRADRR